MLLALVVIAVWEELEAASATVREEANELAEVFWLARRLPEPEGPHLQELARSYATVVSEEEWELMARGRVPVPIRESQNTQSTQLRLRATLGGEQKVKVALV